MAQLREAKEGIQSDGLAEQTVQDAFYHPDLHGADNSWGQLEYAMKTALDDLIDGPGAALWQAFCDEGCGEMASNAFEWATGMMMKALEEETGVSASRNGPNINDVGNGVPRPPAEPSYAKKVAGTGYDSPSSEEVKVAPSIDLKDGDKALEFLRSNTAEGEVGAVDEKSLVRKIDWMIMPLMWACYFLQYLDKTLINYANVMGLSKDNNLTTSQFSNLAMFFYVSYLVCELPHGWLMQRFPTAKYLGFCVIMWGAMVAVTSACNNYGSLVATRLLLGAFEAAVAPSLMLVTGMWPRNHDRRLISFGFQHVQTDAFKSWQIMFLVIGLLTICVGILVVLFLPDNPMSSRLTPAEKLVAITRLRENQMGIENKVFKKEQAIECFKDPQTWLFIIITIASNVPNGAVSSYQATIIRGFGFTPKETALLSLPSGFVGVVAVLAACFAASRLDQRAYAIVGLMIPSILGACLMSFLPVDNRAGRLVGVYLINSTLAVLTLLYSWVGANYSGHTKKVTMNAVLLMSFCLGNILGPLTFQNGDAPDFIPAKIAIIVTCALTVVLALALRFYYVKLNKKRQRLVDRGEVIVNEDAWLMDMTDKQNVGFRYRV
ncbi:Thiamine pathway transporter THI73 [Cyphellophora attinorum]|uniref:Thiamine pathway transporter THI73 n=1 Tax=Cyphellophora attinorum TaxID=1664694 RepID=A0A0N1NZE0_9EURO|nr:Thiamine pathway transporter THI73 [Phialophora attinorum]KPI40402.1 Thiamine pathway transporter THI73 [Phialophora attinorum]